MTALAAEVTYEPSDTASLARVLDFVNAHEQRTGARPMSRFQLVGSEPGDTVELPEDLYRILVQAVRALRSGQAVTVAPINTTLTTQQAADLLGISRPTFVSLLEKRVIPFEQLNSHRRVLLHDVLAYRERRKQSQYAALDALYADESEFDAVAEARVRGARKRVANRGRSDK